MKSYKKLLLSTALFFSIFFVMYFMLSLVGVLFGATYKECVGEPGWFFIYSMFAIPFSGFVSQQFYEEL
jgi:hypothetical protein